MEAVIAEATHHIKIDHVFYRFQWEGRVLSEVFRADEATFFGAEEKDDVVVIGVLTLAVVADRFEQKRGARTVVVGTVVDGWSALVQAVFAAHADVVVVGTKDDCARLVIVNESGEVVSRAVALFHTYGEAHFLGFLSQFFSGCLIAHKEYWNVDGVDGLEKFRNIRGRFFRVDQEHCSCTFGFSKFKSLIHAMVSCISAVRVNAVWRTNVKYGYFPFKILALVVVVGAVFFDDTVTNAQRFSGDFTIAAVGHGVEIHMRNEDFFAQFEARLIVIYSSIFRYWKGLAVAVFTVGL